uniref:Uncharacterized protein n=1 Tax=Vespula pensylvanica TaxID=30213 RepID=A0A834P1J8_VESPE|nr:hypothetical protein H0235_009185 [Vespula pensylvanica]
MVNEVTSAGGLAKDEVNAASNKELTKYRRYQNRSIGSVVPLEKEHSDRLSRWTPKPVSRLGHPSSQPNYPANVSRPDYPILPTHLSVYSQLFCFDLSFISVRSVCSTLPRSCVLAQQKPKQRFIAHLAR